jgi:hypothetical protein
MSLKPRYFAPFLGAAGAAASIAVAPIAAADVIPRAGDESASDTIRDLEAEGYNVAINWVRGYSNVPLSECSVTGINNPDRSADSQETFTTVYVDVSCPNDRGDFGFGFGFG